MIKKLYLYYKKYTYIEKVFIVVFILTLLYYNEFKKQYYKKLNNLHMPKISIFLPIYNKAQYLNRSIGSIQKQTLKDIEIITVNDFSQDNSLEILINMSKNDSRIKIINNNKNQGLLYSRAMGILNSKGKYLMNLDPDDELNGEDSLEYLFNIVKKTRVDVISFGLIEKNSNISKEIILCKNFDYIQYQPEIFNSGYRLSNFLITNKLIKKEIFIKVYKLFKKRIYGKKWNYAEDEIWSSLVNKYANSMICVNKIIFIYYLNNDSLMRNRFNILYMTNLLYWIEEFKKIYDNKKCENFLIGRFKYLINLIEKHEKLKIVIKKKKSLRFRYIKFFTKIISNKKINDDISKKIKNILNSLKL